MLMQSLNEVSIVNQSQNPDGCWFVNCLNENSSTYVALLLMCVDRRTGEEVLIDALLPDDRLATVLSVIRQVLGSHFTLLESFEIEPFGPLCNAA